MDQFVCGEKAPSFSAGSRASRILFDATHSEAAGGQCSPKGKENSDVSLVKVLPGPDDWAPEDKAENYMTWLDQRWWTFDQDGNRRLSRKEIDSVASSSSYETEISRHDKEVAKFLHKNFDGLRALDDKQDKISDDIESEDLRIFADGTRQILMDKTYFESAKKFAANNFDQIDFNRNQKIDGTEIDRFVKQHKLSAEDRDAAAYLKHRLGGTQVFFDQSLEARYAKQHLPFLGHRRWWTDGSGSMTRNQILSMDLSQRISQTERALYVSNVAEDYRMAGAAAGVAILTTGGVFATRTPLFAPFGPLLPMTGAFVGVDWGGRAGRYIGTKRGETLYEQHHKGALTKILG